MAERLAVSVSSNVFQCAIAAASNDRTMSVMNQLYWRNNALPFVELRSTYDSIQPYKPHFHPQFSFGAVISGNTHSICGGREHVLGQGDLILIEPHVVHSCNPIAEQPRSYHMLYLNEAWCLENVAALRNKPIANGGHVIRSADMFAEYVEWVAALPDLSSSESTSKLRHLLTAAVESKHPASALGLERQPLAELIRQALLDSITAPVTLDELADRFQCRTETLIRVFRRAFHITPHAFLNNVRVEQAKQRLRKGEEIANVAADLGFSDQAQLHRTFVNYTASTPGQYRRAQPTAAINFRQ
jgi:AraC-like DNA-binding protein/quercetin dioxygenase-like cupin family protein